MGIAGLFTCFKTKHYLIGSPEMYNLTQPLHYQVVLKLKRELKLNSPDLKHFGTTLAFGNNLDIKFLSSWLTDAIIECNMAEK